jgi:hypothetical protein
VANDSPYDSEYDSEFLAFAHFKPALNDGSEHSGPREMQRGES